MPPHRSQKQSVERGVDQQNHRGAATHHEFTARTEPQERVFTIISTKKRASTSTAIHNFFMSGEEIRFKYSKYGHADAKGTSGKTTSYPRAALDNHTGGHRK